MKRAIIIAVGSELLTPFRSDTNSLFITSKLNDIGIQVLAKLIVGDRRAELAAVIAGALSRTDLLVLTGGLGPTEDDVTRLAVADATGAAIEEDPAILERIRQRFAKRGLDMPAVNRTQAQVLCGATVLPNPNGTAPGQWLEHEGTAIVLLPGPPREMRPMFDAVVAERLAPLTSGARLYRRVLKIAGRSESAIEELAQPVYSTWTEWQPPVSTSILAVPGQIELHFSVSASSVAEGNTTLARATDEMLAVLGDDVYSTDGRPLEQVVGDRLREHGWRVATAESCTGGLVASRLTDVAGSSDYVDRGVVCYSNRAKTELLGVPAELISAHGAVSEAVGVAMAHGIRERAGVEVAVGITGVAGPGGGSAEKPVGTVVIAVVWPGGDAVHRFQFLGGRESVKFQASQAALNLLRHLAGGGSSHAPLHRG
ncbi:MAG TPA: competence/damage-inducible protein A [Vicinamibacterales bacterium]|jgi:nicotinamide-nucleotide amidase